jgi:N-acetylneuraminic acid mutarotase
MKSVLKHITLIFLVIFLAKCERDEITSRNYPRLKTLAVTEITSEGVKFSAEIIFRGNFEVVNYGFVWGENENPTITNSDRTIYSDNIQSKTFYKSVQTTLKKDVSYFVRAFVKTNDYIVYGENMKFLSLGSGAPSITSVTPLEISFCDTVFIKGSNFSYIKDQNSLKFGSVKANIITATDTLIKVSVPDLLNSESFSIEVSTQGNKTTSQETVKMKKPQIVSVNPSTVVLGDTITIIGKNFSMSNLANSVFVNGARAAIISSSYNTLKALIPVVNAPLEVSVSNLTSLRSNAYPIGLLEPTISKLNAAKGFRGDQIEIHGKNFGFIKDGLKIKVDSLFATIVSFSNELITIKIPDGIYNKRNTDISIFINTERVSSTAFTILNPWLQKSNIPNPTNNFGEGYYGAISFSVDGYGYVGLGLGSGEFNSTNIWRYDQKSNSWTKVAPFPGATRWLASAFVIGDKAYVGGGSGNSGEYKDFWMYNPSSDSWSRIADFPYVFSNGVGLSSGGNGYITTRNSDANFWKYNPELNEWAQMTRLPIESSDRRRVDSGFELNGKLYIYVSGTTTGNHELHEFNPSTNTWYHKADMPYFGIDAGCASAASCKGYGYIFNEDSYSMHRYNPNDDSWKRFDTFYGRRSEGVAFELNGVIYFGGGVDDRGHNDIWEHNPDYQ